MPTPETFLPCRSDTHNIGDIRAIQLLELSEVGLRERSDGPKRNPLPVMSVRVRSVPDIGTSRRVLGLRFHGSEANDPRS
jgi:hypothetical protein